MSERQPFVKSATCHQCAQIAECHHCEVSGGYGSDYLLDYTAYRWALCDTCVDAWSQKYLATPWSNVWADLPRPFQDRRTCSRCASSSSGVPWWVDRWVCERCLRAALDALPRPPTVHDWHEGPRNEVVVDTAEMETYAENLKRVANHHARAWRIEPPPLKAH